MPADLVPQPAAAPDCDHHWIGHLRGGEPLSVRICSLCGEPDWDDLRRQLDEREQAQPFSWQITRTEDAAVSIVVGDQWPANDGADGSKLTEESFTAVTFHIGRTLRQLGDRLIDQASAVAHGDDDGWDD